MVYDDALAERIRGLLDDDPALDGVAVSERKMFGGLAFLVAGNLAVAASGRGGIMVRVDPAESEHLQATTPAFPMEMRGRPVAGWLRVDAADLASEEQLAAWVRRGTSYARSLPPK